MIDLSAIEPDKFYWAKSRLSGVLEIVKVSTVFGVEREYWTVAVLGSDAHAMLDGFLFVSEVAKPEKDGGEP